jgi:hypothetical protein
VPRGYLCYALNGDYVDRIAKIMRRMEGAMSCDMSARWYGDVLV